MRTFETGATRDDDTNKPDYRGFLSPFALQEYGEYMLKHQEQADGTMRASDNWKKGIPPDAYASSLIRHVVQFWMDYELFGGAHEWPPLKDDLCAIIFNAQGLLHELHVRSGK